MRYTFIPFVLIAATGAHAAEFGKWGEFEHDFDEDRKPWQEIEAQLPPAPGDAGLLQIKVAATAPHHYLLDRTSLSVGTDGVVRYTMVVKTAGGATNVTYEGMRCATGEKKIYAFGQPDGKWSRNRYSRWEAINVRVEESYQRELFFHYFCTVEGAAEMPAIQQNLRRGGLYRND